ncbi:AAA family ATPase [Brevibacterium sp. JSBI002]|uniref:AAA family ATPase n=1 Tax=Brevibacterium sp. JSBI002 TaxID=2886045 RepID=UPI002231EC3F|nr:AAA family ATPase [Brevibacterium sp. JSBI002]UZD63433.1 AAA family ATPase [Brevibacterium sp. JSBI002]
MKIVGGTCFGDSPLSITGLKTASFFYGPNGSGKTTISRAFAGYGSLQLEPEWFAGAEMTIRVYNRDLVDQILRESNRIPGVFVLGESSVDAQNRLDEIEMPGGDRALAIDRYERAQTSHKDVEERQADAQGTFKTAAWKKYRALVDEHTTLLPAFTGQRGVDKNKDMLVTRLLERGSPAESLPELEDLLAEAEAVFDTGATFRTRLTEVGEFRWSEHDGSALLEQKIVGSSEASLSELVEKLGSEDWVQAGRQHLRNSEGLCPFCQQKAPEGLAKQLETMFDHRYTEQLEELKRLAAAYSSWVRSVGEVIEDWSAESISYLDEAAYQKALGSLNAINGVNERLLEQKLGAPSESVAMSASKAPIDALNAVISEANTKIDAHNRLVESQKEEKPKLAAKCWTYLADVLLREELQVYKQKSAGLQRGFDSTQKKKEEASAAIGKLDDEVRHLQRSVESSQPVIDEINRLLKRSGFTSFHIVNSAELNDGYMLARNGVPLDEHSLSEGERTFIAFLYYYFLLNGREKTAASGKILAVIDDPISSLDSDVLFIVSTLVRDLINRALSKTDHVAQVIVLTHNVYFHKEVTQVRHKEEGSGRSYQVIRKHLTEANVIESHAENPVSTEYERLWSEVRRASQGAPMSIIGLENVLRRILENYFRIAGGIWEDEIVQVLDPAERPVLRSLFNWVNEGSHGVFENLHYSPSQITQDVYLEVFSHVFEKANHYGHYEMMMGVKEPQGAD